MALAPPVGQTSSGIGVFTSELQKAFSPVLGKVIAPQDMGPAMKRMGGQGEGPAAKAGLELGADYSLAVTVTKSGWKFTATALLVDCRTGAVVMNFRSDYFDPKKEPIDRAQRIATKTLEKIRMLLATDIAPKDEIAQ